jgi:hypothetical protein
MENNLSNTSKYLVDADRPIGLAIGNTAQVIQHIGAIYHIHPVAEGGARITASLRPRLDDLLERHTLFGGRKAELKRLNDFLAQRTSGYQFITGLSGFGKTALLPNWVKALQQGGQSVCYHFISRLDEIADEDFALRNLCQQLVAYHGLSGTLPANTAEIRALYRQLLAIPPVEGEKLVIVLDGLDEARGWTPGSDLFPHSLPKGVFVAFSAREIAKRDWLASLKLPRGEVEKLELKTLGLAEIGHLLRAVGEPSTKWAEDPAFLTALYDKSSGDPFYLHYLVRDIQERKITSLKKLEDQPTGLKEYLDRWWEEVSDVAGEQAVKDLLGYLVVAREGHLIRDDLTDISDKDALDGAVFEKTIIQLQRYVVGDDKEGYAFCHKRFRDYVAKERIKKRGQRPYRERLLRYCARWQEHKSKYTLTYCAAHLAHDGRYQDLLSLLTPEWIHAKWSTFGSYSALIQDLNFALNAALKQEPPDFANAAALVVARQTARELMLNFPAPLLVAWVRLGEIRRVLMLLDAIGGGQIVEPLIAVASESKTSGKAGGLKM